MEGSSPKSTNGSSIDIETTNSLGLKLIPFHTEIFLIKPNDEHDLQSSEIEPRSSTFRN
ncbi:7059_t:CDS:2 [Cetraspora pellucida]|uniref:7059_t:CDS:1 n=1 Tax=Cetraspora pellucida TaxID=1433469 RepID=A0A9N9JNC9_9GLOM|nr:7059_t:CDS:2 [Cetraspora pellucida]